MRTEVFFAAALMLSAPMALAQQLPCGPVDGLLKALEEVAQEVPVARGAERRGVMAILTLSPTGSWSVLAAHGDGRGCILLVGEDWKSMAPKPPPGKGA